MKNCLPRIHRPAFRLILIAFLLTGFQLIKTNSATAQIWEPEGLNMPGAWNGWNNPPANNLALASSTQVPGGRVLKFFTGIQRWQTIFSVDASGADLIGGTYEWLFTSGPSGSPWNNKWSNVNVTLNTLQDYTKEGPLNNTITITNGKWYTMNFEDAGYNNTRAIFMETSAQPVDISGVSTPVTVNPGNPVDITVTLSQNPSAEELFSLRYSIDAWVTSTMVPVALTGLTGTAQIPGMPGGTVVSYYIFSTAVASFTTDFDLYTIKMNNNGGTNFSYTVTNPPAVITFANLQGPVGGVIENGQDFIVFGRAEIPGVTGQATPAPGLEAWVGYNATDSDPTTWTNWVSATFTGPASTMDEFYTNLGLSIPIPGTYFYATRFRLNSGSFLYGGYSLSGGGFWDGTANVSGSLTITSPQVPFTRTLDNVIVAAEQSVCYDAKQTITVQNFVVMNGGAATLIAGQNILFMPGAVVQSGGYLKGSITPTGEYCNASEPLKESVSGEAANAQQNPSFRINLYPNPTTSEVRLLFSGIPANGMIKTEITGMRGELKYSGSFTGIGPHLLQVGNYPAGVYVVRTIHQDQVLTTLFVKQ